MLSMSTLMLIISSTLILKVKWSAAEGTLVLDDHENYDFRSAEELAPSNSLEYGASCVKTNSQACKYFPKVTCVWIGDKIFVCSCDFQHNWNATTKKCIPNVFAPCSGSDTEDDCGVNMECRPDIVGSNPNEKMCRCKKGYKIKLDDDGFPAWCVVDTFEDTVELPKKTAYCRGSKVMMSFVSLLLTFFSAYKEL